MKISSSPGAAGGDTAQNALLIDSKHGSSALKHCVLCVSALICDVKQDGVLSLGLLCGSKGTINSSPQQQGVRGNPFLLSAVGGEEIR